MAEAHRELQPGEHVCWSYGAGQAKGQVVEKLTENKKLGSRVFKASPDDPKYLVKSDSSGKEAIKKPETLHKIDEDIANKLEASKAGKESTEGAGHVASASESDARKEEVGAKEKRDRLKQRSTKEEINKEAQKEETAKKVLADTGKGSVGASAKGTKRVAHTGKGSVGASRKGVKRDLKQVTGAVECGVEDEGQQKEISYSPKKDELKDPNDEKVVLAQVEVVVADEGMKDVEDPMCKPPKSDVNAPHDEDTIAREYTSLEQAEAAGGGGGGGL